MTNDELVGEIGGGEQYWPIPNSGRRERRKKLLLKETAVHRSLDVLSKKMRFPAKPLAIRPTTASRPVMNFWVHK